jgi:hypothetical protein
MVLFGEMKTKFLINGAMFLEHNLDLFFFLRYLGWPNYLHSREGGSTTAKYEGGQTTSKVVGWFKHPLWQIMGWSNHPMTIGW